LFSGFRGVGEASHRVRKRASTMIAAQTHAQLHIGGPRASVRAKVTPLAHRPSLRHALVAGNQRRGGLTPISPNKHSFRYIYQPSDAKHSYTSTALRPGRCARDFETRRCQKPRASKALNVLASSESPTLVKSTRDGPLAGKVAIVTGCDRGLGRHIAEALVKKGATVQMACIDMEPAARTCAELNEKYPGAHVAMAPRLDLADMESVRGVAEWYLAFGEPLDILVNNAGANFFSRPFHTAAGIGGSAQINFLGLSARASHPGGVRAADQLPGAVLLDAATSAGPRQRYAGRGASLFEAPSSDSSHSSHSSRPEPRISNTLPLLHARA